MPARARPPAQPLPDVLDALRDELAGLPVDRQEAFLARLTPQKREVVRLALSRPKLLPHQVPPPGDWDTWLLLGGRGSGKTQAASTWFDRHMQGPPCDPRIPGGHRAAIIAPTLGDAWEACVTGPSGLKTLNPSVNAVTAKGGTVVRWPNGSEARLFGAYSKEDVERLRAGGNRCAAWCEELAAWPRLDDAWEHLDFGLRIGPHPKRVCSTTPKARKVIKQLVKDRRVARSHATTADNPHLHPSVRERLHERYAGTRLGRQELEGLLLEDIEGALWTMAMIDHDRFEGDWYEDARGILRPVLPRLVRVGIGVDPPGGATECGIVAAGLGEDGRGYVLDDWSLRGSPGVWGKRVVDLFHEHDADRVVAEVNYGGDMVTHTIATVDANVPIKVVRATRGKTVRAEPIVGLYERHRVVHVRMLPELEGEMTTWVDEPGQSSPNRIDSLVWVLWWLMIGSPHKKGRTTGRQVAEAVLPPTAGRR